MAISATSGTWAIGSGWPWPRMYFTGYYTLAVAVNSTQLSLYELINASDTWTATKMVDLGLLTNIDSVSIASFGKFYIITVFGYDGTELWTKMFSRKPSAISGTGAIDVVSSGDVPHGTALCNYKGQLLVGGLRSNDPKWLGLGTCAVAYGGIGNLIFDPEDDPSAGFVKMPWDMNGQEKIYAIQRLRDHVIVYGSRGIERLIPFSKNNVTGFGQETIWQYGVLGFNCVGGSEVIQCFIDTNYDLCLLSDKLQVLGYRSFMQTLDSSKIIISYEPGSRQFYISDDSLCYVLTENGMYSTHQCVTCIGKYGNIICGFVKSNSDTKIRLTTTETDFGYQAMKSVEDIEFGANYETSADVRLYGRMSVKYSYFGDFIDRAWTALNDRGILTQKVSGRSFKLGLRGTYDSAGTFSLNSLDAKVKFIDKRNIRGRLNVR